MENRFDMNISCNHLIPQPIFDVRKTDNRALEIRMDFKRIMQIINYFETEPQTQ